MGMFDELKDVESREEVVQLVSPLEKVLQAEEEIMRKYCSDKRGIPWNLSALPQSFTSGVILIDYSNEKQTTLFEDVYSDISEKLQDVPLSLEIVSDYLLARENPEKNSLARLRGTYSAALLLATAKKTEKDEIICINCEKRVFNYLFYDEHFDEKARKENQNIQVIERVSHEMRTNNILPTKPNLSLSSGKIYITTDEARAAFILHNFIRATECHISNGYVRIKIIKEK